MQKAECRRQSDRVWVSFCGIINRQLPRLRRPFGPLSPSERRGEGCRGEGRFRVFLAATQPGALYPPTRAPHPAPLSPLRGARGPTTISSRSQRFGLGSHGKEFVTGLVLAGRAELKTGGNPAKKWSLVMPEIMKMVESREAR